MDKINRKIIKFLELNGRISYEEIGRKLGITGIAVKKRIKKLIDNDIISINLQLNVEKLGYYLNLILLEIDNKSNLNLFIKTFEKCPRIISLFIGLSGFNLIALVIAEDRMTLESELLGNCSLRTRKGIRRTEVIQFERKLYFPYLPVRNFLATRDKEKAPCGADCVSCERLKFNKCLGCPATKIYRGDL